MANLLQQPYYAIRTRRPAVGSSTSSVDSTYGSGIGEAPSATHDISRVSYHVKQLDTFAQTLQESATRAFPNRGRSSQRYKSVQVLLLHWKTDDLFVLPELEDLETCFRDHYGYSTDVFAIPADNPHLDLMMRIGALIKEHESEDTLFIVYYGGHAKIDESRQSTWCATRHSGSPSLQWSAIQTLLERSVSDVLILLDCCAGAASATFPNGKSITETISASSWDAIAPDPGRYSFTNALIEVLGEWELKTFSAAMLHAELLARLKHPRPILINGKRFEARSTPVHFMMTSDHRAPSVEMSRIVANDRRPPSPPQDPSALGDAHLGRGPMDSECFTEPNDDKPHVMISLALEDDQRLDLNAWEQWLANFPALAKYVKVQGVFKSHSTLLLLSMPVGVWDLLPEDQACSFVAFIRSNNLSHTPKKPRPLAQNPAELLQCDGVSVLSGTTWRDSIVASTMTSSRLNPTMHRTGFTNEPQASNTVSGNRSDPWRTQTSLSPNQEGSSYVSSGTLQRPRLKSSLSTTSFRTAPPSAVGSLGVGEAALDGGIVRRPLLNQSRISKRTVFDNDQDIPEGPPLAAHVVNRLEDYFKVDPHPSDGMAEYYASHMGVEAADVKLWFHHRRRTELENVNLEGLRMRENASEAQDGPQMILAGHLNDLLEIFTPAQILFIDLRSPSEFQKSHIHGAANLRQPLKFIRAANLDMLDRTFTDDQSRRSFTRWSKTKCMVIYDRNIEAPWECPIAPVLLSKLRDGGGWPGKCLVMKGPFREFSLSFDKYITGDRMSTEAKKYADGLRSATPPTDVEIRRNQARYKEWLRRVEHEAGARADRFGPGEVTQRKAAVDKHQRELEAEFQGRFPDLYMKMKEMETSETPSRAPPPVPPKDDNIIYDNESYFDGRKANLVGSLSTGLDKMREASGGPAPATPAGYSFPRERTPDKLGELPAFDQDDFDEIDPSEAQSPYGPGGGRSAAGTDFGSLSSHSSRKSGREGQQRQGFFRRLRSNNGK